MPQNLFEETCKARDDLYSSIGNVEPDVIAHLINPAFMGGPAWPAFRQAFSVIHRENSTVVITNGLSDPFNDVKEKNTGFGLEIYAETKEKIEGSILESSLFKLVYATAQQAAHSGQIAELVRKYEVITMELFADDCGLDAYQNEQGMVGIMIGIEHPDLPKKFNFPGGEIVLATVQILTHEELNYVAKTRAEGRNILHEKMKISGVYHFLSTRRASLIESQIVQSEFTNTVSSPISITKPWWKLW